MYNLLCFIYTQTFIKIKFLEISCKIVFKYFRKSVYIIIDNL